MKTLTFFCFFLCGFFLQLNAQQVLDARVVASGMHDLSELSWGPDGWIWCIKDSGSVVRVHPETGELQAVLTVPDAAQPDMNGLLGMALSGSGQNVQVFLLYIYDADPDDAVVRRSTRIERYDFDGNDFASPSVILDAQLIWNFDADLGLRIIDDKLFVLSGSSRDSHSAQLPADSDGKILRMNLDGSVPEGNPFPELPYPGGLVWSLGHSLHHNLVTGNNGILYLTDADWSESAELNIVEKAGNYGWPQVHGRCDLPEEILFCQQNDVVEPIYDWDNPVEISGMEFYDGDVFPAWQNSVLISAQSQWGLRRMRFSENGRVVLEENVVRDFRFEKVRDVCVSPTGQVFVLVDSSPVDGFGNAIVEISPWEGAVPVINRVELNDSVFCGQIDAFISFSTTGNFEEDNEFLVVTVDPDNPMETGELIDRISATEGGTYRIPVSSLSGQTSLQIISTHPYVQGAVSGPIDFFTPPDIELIGDTLICDGEGVWLSVNTIPAGAEIRWSTGATESRIYVQESGLYSVQLTWPNGCTSAREEIRVAKGIRPDLTILTDEREVKLCDGDSLLLIARTTNGAAVKWSHGPSGRDSLWVKKGGTYIASAYDKAGCTSSDTIVVTVHSYPDKPEIVRSNNILVCSPAAMYQWYRDGVRVDGGTEQLLTVMENGRYWVEVFNNSGCSTLSDTIEMIVTGVEEEAVASGALRVYPQPAGDELRVEFGEVVSGRIVYILTDMRGEVVLRQEDVVSGLARSLLKLEEVPAGAYHLRVESGQWSEDRIVVKKK